MLLGRPKPKTIRVNTCNYYFRIGGYIGKYGTLAQAKEKAEALGKCVDILKVRRINPLAELEEKICTITPPKIRKEA